MWYLFLLPFFLGSRTGAVLNDSPVGCQSRDLVRPQAATPLVSTFTERYRCQCGTFFCCRFSLGSRTGAVLNDSPVGCQSRDLVRPQAATPLASTIENEVLSFIAVPRLFADRP